jgi:YHS domain-containing protein
LNVPDDAILETGTRAIAYVASGNGVFEPRKVETGRKLGGRTEIIRGLMPGEKIAISGNFLIDSESRMEIASLGPSLKLSADPVCGRTVDAEEAESSEKAAAFNNETFYFCSDRCKTEFEKEPGKYVRKGQTDRKGADRTGTQGRERSWAELLDPNKGSRSIERGGKESKPHATAAKPSPGKYPTTPEVVDWDGPDKEGAPPPKWEKGWGGFPGAKYLGVKQNEKENSPQQSALSEAGGEKSLEEELDEIERSLIPDAGHPEIRPQVQKSPVPGQPQPSSQP